MTEQRILEAQLIQNDKMASIGQLVSGVAHELNNPLTSIAGLTELLLERAPDPSLPHEHLRVIHDQAERAGRIVRNLLTFARKGVAEKAAVDLNDVAARTSLLIMYELQLHGIELESDFSAEPVVVLGDRYELQQVLLNLVTNAVHAVSQLEAGRPRRIRLETRLRGRDGDPAGVRLGPGVPPHLVQLSLHAVLHHQGAGRGHRARALAQLRAGEGARGRAGLRGAARGRGGVPDHPAGLPDAGQQPAAEQQPEAAAGPLVASS